MLTVFRMVNMPWTLQGKLGIRQSSASWKCTTKKVKTLKNLPQTTECKTFIHFVPQMNSLLSLSWPKRMPPKETQPILCSAKWQFHSCIDKLSSASRNLVVFQGDLIQVLSKPYEEWWKGALVSQPDKTGLFCSLMVDDQPLGQLLGCEAIYLALT